MLMELTIWHFRKCIESSKLLCFCIYNQQNQPPSILCVPPVMYFDSSLSKKPINLATSSACPVLLNAISVASFLIATVSVLLAAMLMGVSIRPLFYSVQDGMVQKYTHGAIEFTLTPLIPISFAALFVNPITPCLLAA